MNAILPKSILETFKYQNGRIIVASVASNILRIQQVIDAAYKTNRKVVLTGRDLEKIVTDSNAVRNVNLAG